MKKGINYVEASDVLAVLEKCGLPVAAQKGFVKVAGPKGRAVYIAKTRRVGRVDISGFSVDLPGITTLGADDRFGAVEQQLDFSFPAIETLATLELVIEHMKTLEPREVTRGARAKTANPWAVLPVAQAAAAITEEESDQAGA